jgi:hypothetical protein
VKLAFWLVPFFLAIAATAQSQTFSNDATYTVQGATPQREALLRHQIQLMQPSVLPYRVRFVPHWQYVYAAKIYQLHVPTGMGSKMFTHLASRSVFIDEDCYLGEEWLGHWMAHELGHLATNSVKEEDAERTAREYRTRLQEAAVRKIRSSGAANQSSSKERSQSSR